MDVRQATDALEGAGAAATLPPGALVQGRFRIDALVQQEGGTTIYRAQDVQSGGKWSLRVIPLPVIVPDADLLVEELRRTQALRHKNLVEVESVGRDGDSVFLVTELIDGLSLREFIEGKRAEGRGISLKGASNLVAHVSNGLEYARRVSLHGALSPATIWVNRSGRVKIGCLGLAASVPGIARLGAPAGTSASIYMAPELAAGVPTTVESDVYSLGVILYELLTGHPPRQSFQSVSALVAGVPPAVDAVVERALGRDPQRRWPSTAALKEALQAAAGFVANASRGAAAAPPANGATNAAEAAAREPALVATASAPEPSATVTGDTGAAGAPAIVVGPPAEGPRSPSPASGVSVKPEDLVERWLIQKDKLDFGPFSMAQIRSQIGLGDILADHTLIDNEAGTRCRVRDYPGLGHLAKSAHRRLEQARRAKAEQLSQKSEKKKSMVTTLIVGSVVLAVLLAVGGYVLSRRDSSSGRLATREEEEAEIDSFLKGVKIGGLKATVRRGSHRAAAAAAGVSSSASGGAADEFNNDANFGDVSKAGAGGDETLDDDQIQSTMMANYRKLIPCIVHTGVSEIGMEFVVRGSGKVSAVKVNGQRSGALPGCILGRMQSFAFPKFNGSRTIASWSMSMGR